MSLFSVHRRTPFNMVQGGGGNTAALASRPFYSPSSPLFVLDFGATELDVDPSRLDHAITNLGKSGGAMRWHNMSYYEMAYRTDANASPALPSPSARDPPPPPHDAMEAAETSFTRAKSR